MNKTLLNEYWNNYKAEFGTDNFKKSEGYKWTLFGKMYPIWKWKKGFSNLEMYDNTFKVDCISLMKTPQTIKTIFKLNN